MLFALTDVPDPYPCLVYARASPLNIRGSPDISGDGDVSSYVRQGSRVRAGPLVTARIVSKRSADKHAAQKIAASGKFRERLIALRHVGVHGFGGIQGLPLCNHTVGPV